MLITAIVGQGLTYKAQPIMNIRRSCRAIATTISIPKVACVDDQIVPGGFDKFVQQPNDKKRATETIIDGVHRTFTASPTQSVNEFNDRTNQQLLELQRSIQVKFDSVEDTIQREGTGGGGQGNGFGPPWSSGLLVADISCAYRTHKTGSWTY